MVDITRVSLIDHRQSVGSPGLVTEIRGALITYELQDDGRTLKVWVNDTHDWCDENPRRVDRQVGVSGFFYDRLVTVTGYQCDHGWYRDLKTAEQAHKELGLLAEAQQKVKHALGEDTSAELDALAEKSRKTQVIAHCQACNQGIIQKDAMDPMRHMDGTPICRIPSKESRKSNEGVSGNGNEKMSNPQGNPQSPNSVDNYSKAMRDLNTAHMPQFNLDGTHDVDDDQIYADEVKRHFDEGLRRNPRTLTNTQSQFGPGGCVVNPFKQVKHEQDETEQHEVDEVGEDSQGRTLKVGDEVWVRTRGEVVDYDQRDDLSDGGLPYTRVNVAGSRIGFDPSELTKVDPPFDPKPGDGFDYDHKDDYPEGTIMECPLGLARRLRGAWDTSLSLITNTWTVVRVGE